MRPFTWRPTAPAATPGLHAGDRLERIEGASVDKALDVSQVLARLGSWSKAKYHLRRGGVEFAPNVLVGEAPFDRARMYEYLVGFAYLTIGLFVYFRRGSAQKAGHFYVLCLASFVFLCFHYVGKFNSFDKVIYYGNLAGTLLAPTVFLHFCLTFPEPRKWIRGRTRTALLYAPATLLFLVFVGFSSGALKADVSLIELAGCWTACGWCSGLCPT